MAHDAEPKAVLMVVFGDREVPFATVGSDAPLDLVVLDQVLRLCLRAKQLGLSIRLSNVEPGLRGLLELVGITDELGC